MGGLWLLCGIPLAAVAALVVSAVVGSAGRARAGQLSLLVGCGLTAVCALVIGLAPGTSSLSSAEFSLSLHNHSDVSALSTTRVGLDQPGALLLAAVAAGLCWLSFCSRDAISFRERGLALGGLTIAVGFWLCDNLAVLLIAQGLLLSLGFVMIAWSDSEPLSETGRLGRAGWIAMLLTDTSLLLAVLFASLEIRAVTVPLWQDDALISGLTVRAPAVAGLLGTLVWWGMMGRWLQWPFSVWADAAGRMSGFTLGTVLTLCCGLVGWRWATVATGWWQAAESTSQLVSSMSAVCGLFAVWFAICSTDPRVRTAWLISWSWSMVAATLLGSAAIDGTAGATSVGLLLMLTSLLCGCWLCGLWVTVATATDSIPQRTVSWFQRTTADTGAHTSINEGFALSAHSSETGSVDHQRTAARAAPAPAVIHTRGGRLSATWGLSVLLLGVALLGHRGNLVETGWYWADSLRSGSLLLAAFAASRLVQQTLRARERLPRFAWLLGGLLLLAPWGLVGLPDVGVRSALQLLPVAAVLTSLVALGLGVAVAVLYRQQPAAFPGFQVWQRLGARRLSLPTLVSVCIGWPIRAMSQFVRFADEVLWQVMLSRGIKQIAQIGRDRGWELSHTSPELYALSLTLAIGTILLTMLCSGL